VAVTLAVRGALRPLRRLAADADAIDAASLHHRFGAADLPAELAPIAHGLNSLLARLAAAFDRERRFTADVSHELRTPLAELRALAEVALRWPEATPPEQNYRDVLGIVRQMEGLVATLLAIARCQAGAQPVCGAAIDLRAVLDAAWQAHRATAAERGLAVAWDVPHGTTVRSDPALLLPMLDNLLSNAVAYTPARGRVRVASRALAGGRVELEMSNPCEGLRPEDIPNLSDRFWRSDRARVNGHSGLGLSLVREYARATGASVSHRLSDDGVFTASVVLPAGDGTGNGNGNGAA
jgi:two-component system sensor histidine kinase QseC